MHEAITIYAPDNSIRRGYISLIKEMRSELHNSRWLAWQLFKRDIKTLYKQSLLGAFWVLITPLATVGTFIFLNRAGVFDIGDLAVPYPVFALLGVSLWYLFATGLHSCATSLVQAGPMITKINFARESLVFAALGKGLIAFAIQTFLVSVLLVVYRLAPCWTAIFVPFTLIPILMLTLGLGFILSIANAVARDIQTTLPFATTFLMLLTPVVYPMPSGGVGELVNSYNPLYYLVNLPRDLVIAGSSGEVVGYLYSALFSVVFFLLSWVAFHLTEQRIAERV